MAHHQKSRPRRTRSLGPLPDDLYDHLRPPVRRRGRPAKKKQSEWTVTDDWPDEVPITEAEIEVFERPPTSAGLAESERTVTLLTAAECRDKAEQKMAEAAKN